MENRGMIIGVHGKAGVGKDVAAQFLNEKFGFITLAFADPIKTALIFLYGDAYGLTMDHFSGDAKEQIVPGLGRSPRQLMQTLGTEWGRNQVNPDAWVMIARATINGRRDVLQSVGMPFPGAVISDVRFENEAQWVRDQGGLVIHLRRQSARQINEHVSEGGIRLHEKDALISNNGSIEQLHKKLYALLIDQAILTNGGPGVA